MTLHVNIGKLIKGQVVETGRIEYKSGWNPESVIHSMCAFENEKNNLGGEISRFLKCRPFKT